MSVWSIVPGHGVFCFLLYTLYTAVLTIIIPELRLLACGDADGGRRGGERVKTAFKKKTLQRPTSDTAGLICVTAYDGAYSHASPDISVKQYAVGASPYAYAYAVLALVLGTILALIWASSSWQP